MPELADASGKSGPNGYESFLEQVFADIVKAVVRACLVARAISMQKTASLLFLCRYLCVRTGVRAGL
jgi:hypothetical protein